MSETSENSTSNQNADSRKLHELEVRVAELRKDTEWSQKTAKVTGALLLAFLGFASFFQVPIQVRDEIRKSAAGQVADEIQKTKQRSEADSARISQIRTNVENHALSMFSSFCPVGSIIANFIPPSGLDPSLLNSWFPADGRPVPSAYPYCAITGSTNVPDLRGLFLRGLNEFQTGKRRNDGFEDPNGMDRTPGSLQADEFKNHTHPLEKMVMQGGQRNAQKGTGAYDETFGYLPPTGDATKGSGGSETRPKNAAVFYYVRVK